MSSEIDKASSNMLASESMKTEKQLIQNHIETIDMKDQQTKPKDQDHQNQWGIDPVVLDGLQRQEHRMFVLRVNMELLSLLTNSRENSIEYTNMNSYERLIVHRVADHFKMDHVHDKYRMGVIVFKTDKSELPSFNLQDIPGPLNTENEVIENSRDTLSNEHSHHGHSGEPQSFKIIQRGKYGKQDNYRFNNNNHMKHVNSHGIHDRQPAHNHEGNHSTHNGHANVVSQTMPHHHANSSNHGYKTRQYKSYEEREAAYQQARARIFQENSNNKNNNSSGSKPPSSGSEVTHSHTNNNINNGSNLSSNVEHSLRTYSSNRPKNFVPRVQSSNPRPRFHQPSHYRHGNMPNSYEHGNGQNNYGSYPVMYNPNMMPYVYQQSEIGQHQITHMPTGGIYVDPYTGAQYIVALPEYYENTSPASTGINSEISELQLGHSSNQAQKGDTGDEAGVPTGQLELSSTVKPSNSSHQSTNNNKNGSGKLSLLFGSLTVTDTSNKNDDNAPVVFKNVKQKTKD